MASPDGEHAANWNDAPRVSVIIPTYNWSSVLPYAVASALWQTVPDIEVLVIGDGCTDDSAEVVAAIADPRVRWHNLPANSGNQSTPNNAGLALARAPYIAYLGHDDVWHPDHLATVVDALEGADADLGYGLAVLVGPPGTEARIVTGVPPRGGVGRPVFVPPSSIVHRRELIDAIGPWRDPRTISFPPDRDFLERAWSFRQRFASSGRLTVWKFPASWRPNSYRERRSDEQADIMRRLQAEPEFLTTELMTIVRAYAARTTSADLDAPMDTRPGWTVELNRWFRGLETDPPAAAVEEFARLRAREQELQQLVDERTAWAQGLNAVVAERDATIRDLQALVQQRTAWAQQLNAVVAEREARLVTLQAQLARLTPDDDDVANV